MNQINYAYLLKKTKQKHKTIQNSKIQYKTKQKWIKIKIKYYWYRKTINDIMFKMAMSHG